MSHLDLERLASLADDEPTAAERLHLASCAACAREREAYRALVEMARAERTIPGVPVSSWERLAPALRAEGFLSGAAPARGGGAIVRSHWWLQAAAAVALLVGGAALGRASAGGAGGSAGSAERGQSVAVADAGQGNAQRAGYVDTIPAFKSIDEAQAALTRAEREYRQAVSFLAARDTTTRTFRNSDVYRARLQALDAMAGVAREAVDEVPHDPVLSQYYLSTLAAREATLQQLTTTLPSGVRLTRF